ncbi:hypothetical protein FSP39_010989 [Pinctada imbricata]|uniref:Uncharacterized protein n=1 Tax=Pinctada imbricata TaxID=66713 RepID=A0AA88Y6I4_PINIB|nr:hypothetical protein FSP39_010989 [Pinctada imbricata]
MPQNARVLIAFGPYEACGLVCHRMSRLKGLETVLLKNGHTVEFEEMDDWNKVELWVNNEKIFDCDIRNLDYGKYTYRLIWIINK